MSRRGNCLAMITRSLSPWSLSHRTLSSHAKAFVLPRNSSLEVYCDPNAALEALIWINAWPAWTVTNEHRLRSGVGDVRLPLARNIAE